MSDPTPIGVLVMAYGTASGPDDIERYYTDIRGGRTPSPEHLQELKDRYAAIGNVFPLFDTTRAQAEGLVERLNADGGGRTFRAYLGMKHSPPFIPEGVARMREDGIERAVGIVMAPHWSGMSVETYVERIQQAADEGPTPAFTFVRSYHDHPAFIAFLTARLAEALDTLTPGAARGRGRDLQRPLLARAHAGRRHAAVQVLRLRRLVPVPRRPAGDRRSRGGAARTRRLPHRLAERGTHERSVVGTARRGRDPRPVQDGHAAVVVCSAGFVADHLEVLYDLDIEAKQIAAGRRADVRAHAHAERRPRVPRRAGAGGARSPRERMGRDVTPSGTVVVVGGGVSGLTTAYRLVEAVPSLGVTVLEAAERPGGKIRSVPVGDLSLPAGADSFLARKPWALELCRELGIADELIPPGSSGSYLWTDTGLVSLQKDAPFGIPGDVGDVFRWPGLSKKGRRRAAQDLIRKTRKGGPEETLGELFRRRLGDEATDLSLAPLLAGLFAGDVDRLGVRATFPELERWEQRQGSLIRGSQAASRDARRGREPGPMFLRPRGGVERLTDVLAERLGSTHVRTDARVVALAGHDGTFRVRIADGTELMADAVVLAPEAHVSARLLGGLAPAAVEDLAGIDYASTGVVLTVYGDGTARDLPPRAPASSCRVARRR